MLLRSWNELARRTPGAGRLIAFFGSSNLFWPYSMDRQLGEILVRRGMHDVVLNLGSFGFGDSAHVVSTTHALLNAYRDRPIDLLIFEATPNEMPPLDKEGTRAWLQRHAGARLVLDHEVAAPVVARLQGVQLPLRINLERLAEIARAQRVPFPVVVLDYESNLREWPPSISYFSRPLSEADSIAFEAKLAAAIDHVRRGELEAAFEHLCCCRTIDPEVAMANYLEAKVAEGMGDMEYAGGLYRHARNLDLLRGRLARPRLMPDLDRWCEALGFWFVSVPTIVQGLAPSLPGFDRFVDDVHYRPHVHFAIASAIADRLAAEGWIPADGPSVRACDVLDAVKGQERSVLLQCALNLVMAPPSPYNDERIAEGTRSLDAAARQGIEPALLDEYRLRFQLLAKTAPAASAGDLVDAAESAKQPEPTAATGGISARIERLLLARFGVQMEAGLEHAALLALGIDSLGLAELITALEGLFDITLDDHLFDRQVTFASLCDLVSTRLSDTPARRLAHQQSVARQRALAWRRPPPTSATPSRLAAMARWTTEEAEAQTVAGILARHFRERRQTVAITLLPPGSRQAVDAIDWSWGDLDEASAGVVSGLRDAGIAAGDVIHLLTGHGAFTAAAIVGALRMGVIVSVGHAPSPKLSAEVFSETFGELLQRTQPRAVVVPHDLEPLIRACAARHELGENSLRILSAESIVAQVGSPAAAAAIASDLPTRSPGLALLQYSSGTTGARKGVMFDDRAILRQLAHYARAIDLREDDRIVSWLPLYHDMGLVACFLLPLLGGTPLTLMSPFDWLAAPQLLFQAVTRDRGTLVWLPNFAFQLLADRVGEAQLQGVDLTSLRAVINCSEPITLDSWQRFSDRFAFHGLSRVAFSTCYAMAENIFAVTQGGTREPVYVDFVQAEPLRGQGLALPADPAREDDTHILAVPSSGRLIDGSRVRIVSRDNERTVLGGRQAGLIEITGDSLAPGYYHNDQATQASFQGGWYRTGDIGYLADDQLFVLGRTGDVIIVAGVNLFADDIEQTVSRVAGVKPGRVAAFGVQDEARGTERVIVLFEMTAADPTEDAQRVLRRAIQQRLYDVLDVAGCEVIPVPAGAIRKTSSGKVARRHMKQAFLESEREQQGRRYRGDHVEDRRQQAVLAE